jgi:hypothetical protein
MFCPEPSKGEGGRNGDITVGNGHWQSRPRPFCQDPLTYRETPPPCPNTEEHATHEVSFLASFSLFVNATLVCAMKTELSGVGVDWP